MLRTDLCDYDYSDASIVVKGRISVTGTNNTNTRTKKLNFKNNDKGNDDVNESTDAGNIG